MDRFNRENLRQVRTELEVALNAAFVKHGMTSFVGTFRFTEKSCKATLELTIVGNSDGTVTDREKENFERFAYTYGLNPNDFGRTFFSNGEWYTVTGIKPSRPKFPISAVNSKGKPFKFTADGVKLALNSGKSPQLA